MSTQSQGRRQLRVRRRLKAKRIRNVQLYPLEPEMNICNAVFGVKRGNATVELRKLALDIV